RRERAAAKGNGPGSAVAARSRTTVTFASGEHGARRDGFVPRRRRWLQNGFPATCACDTVSLRMSSMASSRVSAFTVPFVAMIASVMLACGARSLPAPEPAPTASAASAATADVPALETSARPNPALISRKVFFEPVVRSQVQISPDGQRIGWLAAVGSVVNVWVGPADDIKKAQPVTRNASDDIDRWWWAYTSDRILVAQDHDGDEKWHLSAVDLTKNEAKDLTAVDGVRAELVGLSPRRPKEALIADADLRVRFAVHTNTDASVEMLVPAPGKAPWKPFQHVPMENALSIEAVD